MFGYGDKFEYFKCSECGCLQIKDVPENLSKYYPDDYYSFQNLPSLGDNFLKAFFKVQRTKYSLSQKKKSIFSMLFLKIYRPPDYFTWFKKVKLKRESDILEVGCGIGHLLHKMRRDGFLNLTGIDSFIKASIHYKNGVNVLKGDISEIEQQFDFIMLHHSYEHMPQPLYALEKLYRLLRPDRYILIRIPVVSSFAWRKYGENWASLDVPRHLFLHTIESMKILAQKVGFQVSDVGFDSTDFQFWGSEQYIKGISLRDKRSLAEDPRSSIFSRNQLRRFAQQAAELNRNADGDTACFYLYKA